MKIKSSSLLIAFVLLTGMVMAQDAVPTAKSVMDQAFMKASQSNKRVLLMFHASWCGWCRKMDSSLNDISCKKYFDDNFVIEHLTVQESKGKEYLENPGAEALMNSYNGKEQGLPYWVILDKNGKLLFDSQIRKKDKDGILKGSNIGCPASADEVKTFVGMLRETTSLKDVELDAIAKRFRQNEQ